MAIGVRSRVPARVSCGREFVSATDIRKEEFDGPIATPEPGRLGALLARMRATESNALRALMVYGLRIGGAGIIFIAHVALARWLSPAQYGIFANIWVAFILVGGWASLGLGGSMIRFVPEYRAHDRFDMLRGLRRAGRLIGLLSATSVAAVGFAVLWFAGDRLDPAYHGPIVFALLALPLFAMGDVNDGLCRAHGWPLRGIAPNYVIRPMLMILGVGIAALALNVEPTASTAMLIVLIAFSITVLVQTVITENGIRKVLPPGNADYAVKTWLAVAAPLVLMDGMLALMGHVDVLLIGAIRGPQDVALYYAATRVLALIAFVPFAVIAVIAPRFSRFNALDDRDGLAEYARQAVTLSFWPSLFLSVVIVAVGPLLLGAFGEDFKAAYDVLAILVVAVVLRAAVAPAQTMLAMTGNHGICVGILAAALIANTVLNLVFIPLAGTVGAAVATTIAVAFEIALSVIVIKRRFGFVPVPYGRLSRLRPLLRTIVPSQPARQAEPEAEK